MQAGLRLKTIGDSSANQFRYHRLVWTNAAGSVTRPGTTVTAPDYLSRLEFDADGFQGGEMVGVYLESCPNYYGSGTCANSATQTVEIVAPALPLIECLGGSCDVRAGHQLSLEGLSKNSRLRYHEWTWLNETGGDVTRPLETLSYGYASEVDFDARRFNITSDAAIRVQLRACTQSSNRGTCAIQSQIVTVKAPVPAVATCEPSNCSIQAGHVIGLRGDSTASELGYHQWRYADRNDVARTSNAHVGSNGFVSYFDLATVGMSTAEPRAISLVACQSGYGSGGTCTTTTFDLTLTEPPQPNVSCRDNPTCTYRAGERIELIGDSVAAQFGLHQWIWPRPNGSRTPTSVNASNVFRSNFSVDTHGFAGTAQQTVDIELVACHDAYGSGSCSRRTVQVTLLPTPPPPVACEGGACEIQPGRTMRITGTSSTSRLRYHRWEYPNSSGTTGTHSVDTLLTGFRSDFTFSANGFDVTRDPPEIKLYACSNGWKVGTCSVTTRTLAWVAPPTPTLTCSTGPDCRIQAGHTMTLTADSSNTQYQLHWYQWTDGRGNPQRPTYSTADYFYRSSPTFDARHFNPTTEDIEVDLTFAACESGYNSGSCARVTKTITITPEPAAALSCEGGSCSVVSGNSITILGDATNSRLPYHRYYYRRANGTETNATYGTNDYDYRSRFKLDLHGYTAGTETIRMTACSNYYDDGTCVQSTIDVTVLAPPTPVVACSTGATCVVRAGARMVLSANTSNSNLRYHRYTWTNGRNGAEQRTFDTYDYQRLSATRFDATYFPGDVTTDVPVTFQACSSYYNSGTCVTEQIDVSVQSPFVPSIDCEGGACSVPSDGFDLKLFGDAQTIEFPYHTYTWTNAAGTGTETREDYGGTTVYRSDATFSTTGMTGATSRVVTLTACQNNYLRYAATTRGTCRSTTRTVQVVARKGIELRCSVPSCMVNDSDTLTISGDTRGLSGYRYHRYTWVDGNSQNRTFDNNVSGLVSGMTFDATGFGANTTPSVRLTACSGGYDTQPCVTDTISLVVNNTPPPVLTCSSGAGCRVQAGEQISLTADTQNSNFPYHRWEWPNELDGGVEENQTHVSNSGTGFVSVFTFDADNYQNTQDQVVNATFTACTDNYSDNTNAGSCVTRAFAITVTGLPAISISCPTPACTAQSGLSIRLTGDSAATKLPYHEWRWRDAFGDLVNPRRDTRDRYNSDTGFYQSEAIVDLSEFIGSGTLEVELLACRSYYRSGTCRSATQTITLTAPPPPVVTCNFSSNCQVPAGSTVRLGVDARASRLRYHRYNWVTPTGPASPINRDTENYDFNSSYDLPTHGFNPTTPFDLDVEITTCARSYDDGTCVRHIQTIRLTPPTAPPITCLDGPCTVTAGHPIRLAGDSKATEFRYHTWTWQDHDGNEVVIDRTTTNYDFGSSVVFDTASFNGASTRDITLTACSRSSRDGTCVTRTQRVTIEAAAAPALTCLRSEDCVVRAGRSITMVGDSRDSKYTWHTYRWQNGDRTDDHVCRRVSRAPR